MQFSIAAILAVATVAFAAPNPAPQGGVCFDSFDCLLSGGGSCVNFACVQATPTSSGATASATGSLCFDAGDCLLSGGGSCVDFHCVKN